ncbi:MAG TPA: response regulator transcription factor [Steroidobacteraceae bacterium]|nr:response regulator transcription factor [Steroidobacteraceae bacterium]
MPREIIVADDHPLFREALRHALGRAVPDATVVEADTVAALLDEAERHPEADLLLLDLHMPGANGFSALVQMRAHHPSLPVVIISANEDPGVIRRSIGHGAAGFVPKSSTVEEMVEALQAVLDGDVWIPASVDAESTTLEGPEADVASRLASLTPQQFRVLTMLSAGLLNKQIAYELGVSEATIKAHMTAIMQKLGATNRTQAVVLSQQLALDQVGLGSRTPQADASTA